MMLLVHKMNRQTADKVLRRYITGVAQEGAAEAIGVSRRTLSRRKNNPGELTLNEFRALCILGDASDAEIIRMITGR